METINVTLDHEDIVNMIRGIYPPYTQLDELINLKLGTYTGGFADKWEWSSTSSEVWKTFSITQLYALYLILKNNGKG